jgi:hypothetical protein
MKAVKKAMILLGAVLLVFALTSGKGGGGGGSSKASAGEPQEITGLVWEWGTYADSDADSGNNGSSTCNLEVIEVDGQPAYHYSGAITNKFQYGYAGIEINAGDENTLAQLQQATTVSFKVKGDGQRYAFKLPTNTLIKDGGHYEKTFGADGGGITVTIPVKSLSQQSWAASKRFDQADVDCIQFQTTHNGKPGPFDLTVWDLKLYK